MTGEDGGTADRASTGRDFSHRSAPAHSVSVSAVVVSYRTGPVLEDCLDALQADVEIADIIVVDNGNPPEVEAGLRRRAAGSGGRVRLVGEGMNRGFAAGCNLGVRSATGERLLFVNPDAVLKPGSVGALEAARLGRRAPVLVGGKIVGPDGAEQRGGRRGRLDLASGAGTFLGLAGLKLHPRLASIDRSGEPEPEGPTPMPVVSGAFMYLSWADFMTLGGFDERYFLHVEDIDLCRRVEKLGGEVIYTPHAQVVHEGATSDAPVLVVERWKAKSLARYFDLHAAGPFSRAGARLLSPFIGAALMLRALGRRRRSRTGRASRR